MSYHRYIGGGGGEEEGETGEHGREGGDEQKAGQVFVFVFVFVFGYVFVFVFVFGYVFVSDRQAAEDWAYQVLLKERLRKQEGEEDMRRIMDEREEVRRNEQNLLICLILCLFLCIFLCICLCNRL